jgi:hypothetical protein
VTVKEKPSGSHTAIVEMIVNSMGLLKHVGDVVVKAE